MAPFVGRNTELERLRSAFRDAGAGRSRIVLVTGDPGIGKTRLLEEFRSSVGSARCLVGRGSPLASAIPFSVLAEAIQSHLRVLPIEEVRELCGAGLEDLAVILPAASAAIGSAPPAPSSRLGLLEAISGSLAAIATDRPLVVELDDLHQADPSTWEALAYVGRSPLAAPVLIVAALRTASLASDPELGRLVDALRKDELADELRLSPLDREAVDELAAASLGANQATADLTEWLFGRSRGNALFTVALLDELAADPRRRVVPASVKERIRIAADALDLGPRQVLEAGAVLGGTFSFRALTALVGGESEGLDELVRGGLLVERDAEGTVEYDFVHPLVQEAVYENMGAARRSGLHRRAAEHAPAGLTVRAYHAARGAAVGDPAALELIREAARLEERHQSHREALSHLRAALALTPSDATAQRAELLDEIAWQAAEASDHDVGIAALEELEPLVADDPRALATTKMRLASFLATGAGDLVSARATAEEAAELFRGCGATDRLPAALNELAWIRGEGGDLAEQVRMSGEAIALAEQMDDAVAVMHALGAHGHGLSLLGRTEEGVAAGRRGVAMAEERNERAQVAWHTGVLADAFQLGGRPAEAAAVVDPLIEAGLGASDVAYFTRARVNWTLGHWEEALADCRTIQAMHPTNPSVHSAWTLSLGALVLVATDRAAGAAPLLAEADRTYGDRDFYAFSCWHHWASGLARWLLGDVRSGRERLERAASGVERLGSPPVASDVLPDVVEVLTEVGDLQEAARWTRRLSDHREVSPMTRVAASHAEGILAAARGDRRAAADALLAAAEGARAIPAPFVAARALECLGTVVPGEASIAHLVEAGRLYASLPAPAFEQRVLARLRTVGPAGRRASQSVGALTVREREVAALARSGLSTKTIAGRLHLSERTVESHLAHVYRKLQIEGRHELGRWDPASERT